MQQINIDIKRHLSTELQTEFQGLNSGSQRVLFAYNILEKHALFPELIVTEKSDEESEERRNYGNHNFLRLKKYGAALKHYNKAVACAKTPRVLSLAYGNRSAVYFHLEMYETCLKDIENSLELFPSEKLEDRKRRALLLVRRAGPDNEKYYLEVPEIPVKNETIPCASGKIKINSDEKNGRFISSVADLNPGEIICKEGPFAKILLREFYLTHCYECLRPSGNLIPCVKCPLVLFCSQKCRDLSGNYHRHECGILDSLLSLNMTKLQLLALRVVLKSELSGTCELSGTYESGKYPEIHNLVTNESVRSFDDLFGRAVVAAILLYFLEKTEFLGLEFTPHSSPICQNAREGCADLLLRHLQTAPSNMHEISEIQGVENTTYEITEIGAGAYAFLSLLNHSCCPNVVRHCHGTDVVLRALKTVKKGEQLFDNYGYHFALMEKPERQTHLKEQYLFDCECEACVNNYPLYSELSKGHDNFIVEENDLNDLLCAKRSTALKLLPALVENATKFEMNPQENRVEILDNQEVMKQCFAIFANKNTLY